MGTWWDRWFLFTCRLPGYENTEASLYLCSLHYGLWERMQLMSSTLYSDVSTCHTHRGQICHVTLSNNGSNLLTVLCFSLHYHTPRELSVRPSVYERYRPINDSRAGQSCTARSCFYMYIAANRYRLCICAVVCFTFVLVQLNRH